MGLKIDLACNALNIGANEINGIVTTLGDPGTDANVATEKAVRDAIDAIPGGGVTDHGELSGLSDNDHPQYALAGSALSRWTSVAAFTRTANSTFTVTNNTENQGIFIKGRWIRYRATAGTWRYGMVVLYATGTVTLSGHPLTTSDDDEMNYGDLGVGGVLTFVLPGNSVVANPASFVYYWQRAAAFIVRSTWRVDTAPTGSTILGNVEVNGADIHASEIIINSTSEVSSGVDIQVANYDIQFGETLAVTISQVGTTVPGGNASTVSVAYVIP